MVRALCIAALGAALPWSAAPAQGKIISCLFTEPFIGTVYYSRTRTLTVTYDVDKRREKLSNISISAAGGETFELRNTNKVTIQRLERSYAGTDGMSDRVFPYEVTWTPGRRSLPATLFGGCESDTEKAK